MWSIKITVHSLGQEDFWSEWNETASAVCFKLMKWDMQGQRWCLSANKTCEVEQFEIPLKNCPVTIHELVPLGM